MQKIKIYYQERQDGGARMGLQLGSEQLLQAFIKGQSDSDPRLTWYIDLNIRIEEDEVEQGAAAWLEDHASEVQNVIEQVADDVPSGIDNDGVPMTLKVKGVSGLKYDVVLLAIPRMTALKLSKELRQLARKWPRLIEKLEELAAA